MTKTIFISGANISAGGPLEIYKKMLNYVCSEYPGSNVYAVVQNKQILNISYPNLEYIEIPNYKRFMLLKFYYEYVYYFFISKRYNIDLWLSLNDCTPTVRAGKRVVYCHNATPFYRRSLRDYIHPSFSFLQSFYYSIFYRINISKNDYVIVQQNWIRAFFIKKYNLSKKSVIVNHPVVEEGAKVSKTRDDKFRIVYPTKAEPYKNIEIICQAISLIDVTIRASLELVLTVSGTENSYSKELYRKYKNIESIKWIGTVSRKHLEDIYAESDAMVFSSLLETWGLPITEYMRYNQPILVIDLPYAKETIGSYNCIKFFGEGKVNELAGIIRALVNKDELVYDRNDVSLIEEPFTTGLNELFSVLLSK